MINKEIVQVENISVDELTEIIAEKLVDKFAKLILRQNDDDLLTRAETAEILKINFTSLWKWTKMGKLTAYGMGNRVYYKRGEIMRALVILNR